MTYKLLDSGEGEKLEQYGDFVVARPDPQAVWVKSLPVVEWEGADATFGNSWKKKEGMPESWVSEVGGLKFQIELASFKHTGVFPEHAENWAFIENELKIQNSKLKILNLFGYTGGATLAAAKAGAEVTHVDASKPAITAARENVNLNGLEGATIKWMLDDVKKFVEREVKRGNKYDGVVMDPPSFGRGAKGELWKIEDDLLPLLQSVKKLLSPDFKFVLLNGYAAGYTPTSYAQLLSSVLGVELGDVESGELVIKEDSPRGFSLPAGIFARYVRK